MFYKLKIFQLDFIVLQQLLKVVYYSYATTLIKKQRVFKLVNNMQLYSTTFKSSYYCNHRSNVRNLLIRTFANYSHIIISLSDIQFLFWKINSSICDDTDEDAICQLLVPVVPLADLVSSWQKWTLAFTLTNGGSGRKLCVSLSLSLNFTRMSSTRVVTRTKQGQED